MVRHPTIRIIGRDCSILAPHRDIELCKLVGRDSHFFATGIACRKAVACSQMKWWPMVVRLPWLLNLEEALSTTFIKQSRWRIQSSLISAKLRSDTAKVSA